MATSLLDLIQPYFLAGIDLGPVERLFQKFAGVMTLSMGHDEHASVATGTVAWKSGEEREGLPWGEGDPGDLLQVHFGPPSRDTNDYRIEFRLIAPRIASPTIKDYLDAQANAKGKDSTSANLRDLFEVLGGLPIASEQNTDYPCFAFRLELFFGTIAIYLPPKHFAPALRGDSGWWEIDWAKVAEGVYFELPNVALLVEQRVEFGDCKVSLKSWGASSLDDPLDLKTGELIRMVPSTAIHTSQAFGFELDQVVLDLSEDKTPPELIEKSGVGQDFEGLWLKEVRFFAQPARTEGLQFEVTGQDLLIDFRQGISGLLAASVVQRVNRELKVNVRFFDGNAYLPITKGAREVPFPGVLGETVVDGTQVTIAGQVQLRLDIQGGLPPYQVVVLDMTGGLTGTAIAQEGDPSAPFWTIPKLTTRLKIAVTDSVFPSNSEQAAWTETVDITASKDPPKPADADKVWEAIVSSAPIKVNGKTYTLVPSDYQKDCLPANVRVEVPGEATEAVLAGGGTVNIVSNKVLVPDGGTVTVTLEIGGSQSHDVGAAGGTQLNFTGDTPESDKPEHMDPALEQFRRFYEKGIKACLVAGRKNHEQITVQGFAHPGSSPGLPDRRAEVARRELISLGIPNNEITVSPNTPDATVVQRLSDRVEFWWVVSAKDGKTLSATVSVRHKDFRPPEQLKPPPSFLRRLELRVRLERNKLVLFEVIGEIDFNTALEKQKLKVQSVPLPGGPVNPADGVTDFRLTVMYDTATGRLTEELALAASDNDLDGLVSIGPGLGADIFGALLVFAPVIGKAIESAVEDKSKDGLAALEVGGASLAAFTGVFHTQSIILHGVQLSASEMYSRPMRLETMGILFDYSVTFNLKLDLPGFKINATDAKVRYKALGLKASFLTADDKDKLDFVFDTSKGYRFDLANPGLFTVSNPVGKFLSVVAVRIARKNPVVLEMDLDSNANLGVVTLERFRLIAEFPDGDGSPKVRLIPGGIGINIPGTLIGHGYISINPGPTIEGSLDLTFVALRMRASAKVRIVPISDPPPARSGARAVIVTIEVKLPSPIAIGGTGLGIFGFLGLLAMHYRRTEDPADALPALAWFNRAKGDPTDITNSWTPEMDRFAIGLGAILGTLDGGIILNMKGMLLVELPGPRILVVSKIDMLKPRPDLDPPKAVDMGGTLGVVDLDFQRGRITIAALSNYQLPDQSAESVLSVVVPVEALFQFNNAPPKWHAYFGSISSPATASFLGLKVTAYFMLEGYRIEDFPGPFGGMTLPGFAVALGIRAGFNMGGGKVYFRAAARLDVGVSFAPFLAAGVMELEGELRLFIVTLSASASLAFRTPFPTIIDGKVCAEIKLGFRKLRGCASFHFEKGTVQPAPDIPLLLAVQLQSRSPALIEGQATDAPVDGATEAKKFLPGLLEEVAIDSIPILQLRCAPAAIPNGKLTSVSQLLTCPRALPGGRLNLGAGNSVRFELKDVKITNNTTGEVVHDLPAVWRAATEMVQGQDTTVDLALNSTQPTGTPRAFERSDELNKTVAQRWGGMCQPIAPAAPVLWTFHQKPLGTSSSGWKVVGVAAPDPPQSTRSQPPDSVLQVWGFGGKASEWENEYDRQAGKGWIDPAEIVGDPASTGGTGSYYPGGNLPTSIPWQQIGPTLGPAVPAGAAVPPSFSFGGSINAAAPLQPLNTAPGPVVFVGTPVPIPQVVLGRVLKFPRWWADAGGTLASECGIRIDGGRSTLIRILLAVSRDYADVGPDYDGNVELQYIYLRSLDAKGIVLDSQAALRSNSVAVADFTALKANWPGLPATWEQPLQQALAYFRIRQPDLACYVITWAPASASEQLDVVCCIPRGSVNAGPVVMLGAVELLRTMEHEREADDKAVREADRQALAASLEVPKPFLFDKGSTYRIDISYSETKYIGNQDPEQTNSTETFYFKTQAEAPKRLDPWVLTTSPAADEPFHFTKDPLHIIFNDAVVFDLFQKYGKDLALELRQGNGDHPSETPPKLGPNLPRSKTRVLTPFEDAVRTAFLPDPLKLPPEPTKFDCFVQAQKDPNPPDRHPDLEWRPNLARYMPYTLAIIATEAGGGTLSRDLARNAIASLQIGRAMNPAFAAALRASSAPPKVQSAGPPPDPIYEISFHTSRFESADELAATLSDSPVRARLLRQPLNIASSNQADPLLVTDSEMEAILVNAGLESLPPAKEPGFTMLWEPSGPTERLAAILVDSPERLFRQRPVPTLQKLHDAHGWVERWVNSPMDVMTLEEGTASKLRQRVLRTSGGLRTLFLLQPLPQPSNSLHLVLRVTTAGFFTSNGETQTRDIDIWTGNVFRDAPWRQIDG